MSGHSDQTDPSGDPATWVTMREAAEQAEVPVSKVRGLYRASRVRSRKPTEWAPQEERPDNRLVMVVLEDVLAQVGSAKRVDDTPVGPPSGDVDAPADTPPSSDVDAPPDTPPSSDVDAPPDTPPSSDVDAPPDTPPSSDVDAPADTPPSSDVDAPADTPPSSDVDAPPDTPPSSDVDAPADTPPSSDVDAPADTPPSSDVDAPSSTIAINRDLLFRLTARLEEIQRSHGELAAARERAAREEEERDALRETLGKLQRRIERLERLYATEDSTDPSAGHANSADDAPVPYPDVEVEWQMEEPQEPKERSRFSFLQRRDHRS